ncbi:AAA family ATPase [Streptococcus parasanguinis]|uniref:ATP-dependent nuclease n=1 Tax=Streptococcus parasanguinis TaxID=1318 RepID=UPI001BDB5E77|nr:AAA family ATPase [Streptococcus parasanguinis]MBT0907907.1 AAA family ATPase [Streptococcus parasanguinis]
MEFKKLVIENFRNFSSIEIDLSNKNVIFGMNDSGKTNLLFAIRYLLDRTIRNKGFIKSDYHKHDTSRPIKIRLELDLSDRKMEGDEESLKTSHSRLLISTVAGARNNSSLNTFFISLEAVYNEKELFGNPVLSWGSTLDNLVEVPQYGTKSDIDKIFQIVYVNPAIELDSFFKRNRRLLFSDDAKTDEDIELEKEIENNIYDLNKNISNLNLITSVQSQLTNAYKNYRQEDLEIKIQSEISISGYLDNLTPYINWNGDTQNYPTSGDGRQKLLSYAINHLISERQYSNKVIIYLIEEPENSLHSSVQVSLSKQLFIQNIYEYFFLTTHSAEILYEMDRTQLIKITNKRDAIGHSSYYRVPEEFSNLKKKLNKSLAQSIFYDRVLLVEGASEYYLFSAIFENFSPDFEAEGKYLLQVDGTNFKPYVNLYRKLGIDFFVKTDNDLKASRGDEHVFSPIGLNRCIDLLDQSVIPKLGNYHLDFSSNDERKQNVKSKKEELYSTNSGLVSQLNAKGIFISEIDLENDLAQVLSDSERNEMSELDFVNWLQSSKQYNMLEYINNNLTQEIALKIVESGYFKVLAEFLDYE